MAPSQSERRGGLHWGYRFWLGWLAGLVALGILGGILDAVTGRPFGGGVYVLMGAGAMALLGSLLWMGARGGLPGVEHRLRPVWRAALALLPLGINGLVGLLFFTLVTCDGGFFCGNGSVLLGLGIAAFLFLVATVGEILAFLLVWGVVYLVRKNSKGRLDRPASA